MNTEQTPFGSLNCLSFQGEPLDLARTLSDRPGFVFLDSSQASANSLSILAIDPEMWLKGSLHDFPTLQRQLRELGPLGGLLGHVEFDGAYCFGKYRQIWVYRHADGQWLGPCEPLVSTPRKSDVRIGPFTERVDREAYLRMVRRAKEYIAAGDIYQVCLSYPFEAGYQGDPWKFYESLRRFSPSPNAAFLRSEHTVVASASPETFLEICGSRIMTRPIKGTRPRSTDPELDVAYARELKASTKENAELLMITDLERNDLGRICRYGSVKVTALNALQHFPQVHHLVSTVEGELLVDHVEALARCFPGGSISGAPKRRALEIIEELEEFPRGLYTGAIGYFGAGGQSAFNIAIRTAEFSGGKIRFHSGAGIVADSDPEAEWQETRVKARTIMGAAGQEA